MPGINKLIFRKKYFSLLIITLIASSCAQLIYLDQAQDNFNKAASLENKQALGLEQVNSEKDSRELETALNQSYLEFSPKYYYNISDKKLEKALNSSKYKNGLKKDNLLGNALALKALTEWKLEKFKEANVTAIMAQEELKSSGYEGTRDYAVMAALPGLISNDEAFLATEALFEEFAGKNFSNRSEEERKEFFTSTLLGHYKENIHSSERNGKLDQALTSLNKARTVVSPSHEVQKYLVMSQLAVIKNWNDEKTFIDTLTQNHIMFEDATSIDPLWSTWIKKEQMDYDSLKNHYLEELQQQIPNKEMKKELMEFWKSKI